MEEGIKNLKKAYNSIEEDSAWNKLYMNIKSFCNKKEFAVTEAKKPENKPYNRYGDVSPYDHTRIVLQRTDSDYINASLVKVPETKRAYILTQGPLDTTIGHFWLMVWEQNSACVIMLNKIIEKNQMKCSQYWPAEIDQELLMEDVSLSLKLSVQSIESNFVYRSLILTDLQTQKKREINQYHYTAWPDFGVPESPKTFIKFLDCTKAAGSFDDVNKPPVIHCSAGIGRSGTFCLVESCLVEFQTKSKVEDIQQTLINMRESRMGLIQTADQLKFSYQAIIEGAKQLAMKTDPNANGALSKESNENNDSDSDVSLLTDEDSESLNSSTDTEYPPPLPPRAKVANGVKRKYEEDKGDDGFSITSNKRLLYTIGLLAIVIAYVFYKK